MDSSQVGGQMKTWRLRMGKDLHLVAEQRLESWPCCSQPSVASLTLGLPNGA